MCLTTFKIETHIIYRIYTFISTFIGGDSSWDVLVQRSLGASIITNNYYAGSPRLHTICAWVHTTRLLRPSTLAGPRSIKSIPGRFQVKRHSRDVAYQAFPLSACNIERWVWPEDEATVTPWCQNMLS